MADNIVFLSPNGAALALALRLQQEGNDVTVWLQGVQNQPFFKGILKRVDNLGVALSMVRPNTLLVLDDTGGGRTADRFRKQDIAVIGGSRFTDRLEDDLAFGLQTATRAGIIVPETFEFSDVNQAKQLLNREPAGYVFKPKKRSRAQSRTFATKDPEEMLAFLSFVEGEVAGKSKFEFTLQKFVDGVKVGTTGWFDGQAWVPPFIHDMGEKHLAVGNIGPLVKSMGSVVFDAPEPNRLVAQSLLPITPFLSKAGYLGPIHVDSIVKDQAVGLGFTAGIRADSIYPWTEMLEQPVGEFLYHLAERSLQRLPITSDIWGSSVRLLYDRDVSSNRYPVGVPVLGVSPDLLPHVWFRDVQSLDGRPVTAGVNGDLLMVTAVEDTLPQSIAHVYDRLEHVRSPRAFYRQDIGTRVERDIQEISNWLEPVDAGQFAASVRQSPALHMPSPPPGSAVRVAGAR